MSSEKHALFFYFSGLEYKVVILSCVHKREAKQNTEGQKFGLLSDRNMLNTAFTRTKLAIIAVGHAVTVWSLGKCHVMWREYIKVRITVLNSVKRKSKKVV